MAVLLYITLYQSINNWNLESYETCLICVSGECFKASEFQNHSVSLDISFQIPLGLAKTRTSVVPRSSHWVLRYRQEQEGSRFGNTASPSTSLALPHHPQDWLRLLVRLRKPRLMLFSYNTDSILIAFGERKRLPYV